MTPTKVAPVTTKIVITTAVKQTLPPTTTKLSVLTMPTAQTTEITENQELSTHLVRLVAKRITPLRKGYFGASAANRPPLRNRRPIEQKQNQQNDTQINAIENV